MRSVGGTFSGPERLAGRPVVFPCGPKLSCGLFLVLELRIISANTEQVGEIDRGDNERSQSQEEGWRVPSVPSYQGIQSEQDTNDGLACPDAQHKPERAASHPSSNRLRPSPAALKLRAYNCWFSFAPVCHFLRRDGPPAAGPR